MQFSHIVVGGTFDHIHKGHEAVLTKAYSLGKQVTIGLTSDLYVSSIKYQVSRIKTYETRKKKLEAWLKKQGVFRRTVIVPIDDAYGPSTTDNTYDAIVVSTETEQVAKKINSLRTKQGISPLAIIVVPMVPAQDAKRISSTRIRNGEIDHDGRLILPETLRSTLTKPIGTIIPDKELISVPVKNTTIISVGDTTTETLLSQGIIPTLAIIDFQARRQAFDWKKDLWDTLTNNREILYFVSGPGFIHTTVMDAIDHWSKQPKSTLFIIDGEEDLLVLPAILYAPVGSVVYYGQPASPAGGPHQGIVQVIVTIKIKQYVQELLSKFT